MYAASQHFVMLVACAVLQPANSIIIQHAPCAHLPLRITELGTASACVDLGCFVD
jgi:hypothetical protein